eukprot:NODE_3766_length_1989_cov_8.183673.p1 GENE.NODE_3766_length_1989_cov_8.183673~~NODE_3766_length_1989_cov_8.183673.p1  ORF type:complete len:608 (-),score=62.26 NODE_3766_length_1989_cov_8.183673:166-1908(-)
MASSSFVPKHTVEHRAELCNGICALRDEGLYVDVSLEVGGRIFHAHKVILCGSSAYFRSMFDSPFSEGSLCEPVPISNISADAFEALLAFLYTGSIESLPPDAVCVTLRTADQFCVPKMVTACTHYLLDNNITCLNCCDVMRTASDLGNYGQKAPWQPLFRACVAFAAAHLSDLTHGEGRSSFLRLDKGSMNAVVEAVFPLLLANEPALVELWHVVAEWGHVHFGATDIGLFFHELTPASFDSLDFVEGTHVSHSLSEAEYQEVEFNAGGLSFAMAIHHNHDYDVDQLGYSFCLTCESVSESAKLIGAGWFCQMHSSVQPARFVSEFWTCFDEGDFFYQHLGTISEVEVASVARGESAEVQLTVKITSLLNLCIFAATRDFASCPQSILEAFPVAVLQSMLVSDDLGITQDRLLDALVTFGETATSETARGVAKDKFDVLLLKLELGNITFSKLLDAVRQSHAIQQSEPFADALTQFLRTELSRPSAEDDGMGSGDSTMDTASVEGLVRWFRRPPPCTSAAKSGVVHESSVNRMETEAESNAAGMLVADALQDKTLRRSQLRRAPGIAQRPNARRFEGGR